MAQSNLKPTRMELLLAKKKLKLAKKGHKLLKQKRDVLVMEFFKLLKVIKQLRGEIAGKMTIAQNALDKAQAIEGEVAIERIAIGLATESDVKISTKSIMGVDVPSIEEVKLGENWLGYYDHSIELDNAIFNYKGVFSPFIKLAEKQLVLMRLADEIQKTKRRVNSLEYLTIPRLQRNIKIIALKLEELERENFTRLKKIKANTAARKAEQNAAAA